VKPLRLVMEAFGPFRDRQEIDFRELGSRALFLVEGDTGSGKTTIFDAMCVALYGKTSVGRDQGHMKSLSAAPESLCRVEFDFMVGGRSFRVQRVPDQERPARRGSKSTKQPHTATLWEISDGAEHVLATKLGEVADRIVQILGLSADQFCQVVLLPQGHFEKMLRAHPSERESVMKVLFQTDRYLAIQDRLVAQAKEAETEVQKALLARDELLRSCGCADASALDQLCLQRNAELVLAKESRAQLADAEGQARAQLQAAHEIARKLDEKDKAQAALDKLTAQLPAVQAQRTELERAERALHLAATDASLSEAEKRGAEIRDELAAKTRVLEMARARKQETERRRSEEEGKQPEHDKTREELHRLEKLRGAVVELADLRAQLSKDAHRAKAAAQESKTVEVSLAESAKALETAEKQHGDQKRLADVVADRERALKAIEEASARAARAQQQRVELTKANENLAKAKAAEQGNEKRVAEAKSDLARAQQTWIEAQAAVLAGTLAQGSPCPVCGSLDHPHPAKAATASVDRKVLLEKQEAVAGLERELMRARERRGELEIQVARLSEGSGLGDAIVDPNELAQARARLKEAESAAQSLLATAATMAKLHERRQQLEDLQRRAAEAVLMCEAQRAATAGQVNMREKDVPEDLRDPAALSRATGVAKDKLRALTENLDKARAQADEANTKHASQATLVADAQAVLDAAQTKTLELRDKLDREIAAHGFASVVDYQSAKRGPSAIVALRKSISDSEGHLKSAQSRLADATAAARDLIRPDLAVLETRVQIAKSVVQEADTKIGGLDREVRASLESQSRLRDLLAELQGREGRFGALKRLASAANGTAPRNPGFHRFVLAERLDEVLLAANRRLGPMSNDRYVLRRVRIEEDQRMSAGLNLEVLDGYSGRARPIDTLSGGESFQAALALALGLADVVQQHAGGVKLDTVFVDEGFGSLDPNALELAMECLENLRQDGRLIGVISHVAEMKERIRDAQLRVTNHHGVSRAAFVVR
jgi:exonuclease SbcC